MDATLTLPTTQPRTSIFNRIDYCIVALLFTASIWLQLHKFINWDVSWYLEGAERLFNGKNYLNGVFDNNTPMVFWFFYPLVWLKQTFQVDIISSAVIYVHLLTFMMFILTIRVLNPLLTNATSWQIKAMNYLVLFTFLFDFLSLFGARECLMCLLLFPYIVLKAYPQHTKLDWQLKLLIGCLAGIGIALNPFFALLIFTIEIYSFLQNKKIFIPLELASASLVFLSYLITIYIAHPEYYRVIIPVFLTFSPALNSGWQSILFSFASFFIASAGVIFIINRRQITQLKLIHVFLLCALVSYAIFLLHQKYWFLHQTPVIAFSLFLLGTIYITRNIPASLVWTPELIFAYITLPFFITLTRPYELSWSGTIFGLISYFVFCTSPLVFMIFHQVSKKQSFIILVATTLFSFLLCYPTALLTQQYFTAAALLGSFFSLVILYYNTKNLNQLKTNVIGLLLLLPSISLYTPKFNYDYILNNLSLITLAMLVSLVGYQLTNKKVISKTTYSPWLVLTAILITYFILIFKFKSVFHLQLSIITINLFLFSILCITNNPQLNEKRFNTLSLGYLIFPFMLLFIINSFSSYYYYQLYSKPESSYNQIIQFFSKTTSAQRVYYFGSVFIPTLPLQNRIKITYQPLSPTCWTLPAINEFLHGQALPSWKAALIQQYKHKFLQQTAYDFMYNPPDYVMVDTSKDKFYFHGRSFDYIQFLSQNKQFAQAWKSYQPVKQIDVLMIYARK